MVSRDTRLVIDTQAITHNARVIGEMLGDARLMAVVKANGYGHGIREAARAAIAGGASAIGVATVEEGLLLRESGIEEPILALDSTSEEAVLEAARAGLSQTIHAHDAVAWMRDAAKKLNRQVRAHIQVETGMRRLGVAPEELPGLLEAVAAEPGIAVEGVFSHFADTTDRPFTREQMRRFGVALGLTERAFGPLIRHIASSGAALSLPGTRLDMARCGIALYGYAPDGGDFGLRPAMSVRTSIVQLQRVPPGESVSYGRTYYTQRDTLLATLPVGYGDGYPRCIGNRGRVLVRGARAPVVGRVCMDLCMADVTGIPGVSVGDEVALMGAQGDERVTAEDWARWCGTIAYEPLLWPTQRMRREVL